MTSRGAFLATLAGFCAVPPAASAQELTRLSLTAVRYGVIDHDFAARELIGPDALRLKTR